LTLPVRLLLIDEPLNGLDAAATTYLRAQLTGRASAETACIGPATSILRYLSHARWTSICWLRSCLRVARL
jgi:ABC-type molybdenum transport system ATPase subunit/photorepair protein PhrA